MDVCPQRALKASDKKVDKRQQGRAPFNTSACRFFEDHKLETPGWVDEGLIMVKKIIMEGRGGVSERVL